MVKIGDKIKILKDVPYSDLHGQIIDNERVLLYGGDILAVTQVDGDFIVFDNTQIKFSFQFYTSQGYFELIKEDNKKEINTQEKIQILFSNFKNFLQEKNKRYGDSVINPVKVFSKVEPENKACIRLDEKLQRIINSTELKKNDVCDTFGYLALLMIDKGWLTFEEMLD